MPVAPAPGGTTGYRCASAIENISGIKMALSKASETVRASRLKQNEFLMCVCMCLCLSLNRLGVIRTRSQCSSAVAVLANG